MDGTENEALLCVDPQRISCAMSVIATTQHEHPIRDSGAPAASRMGVKGHCSPTELAQRGTGMNGMASHSPSIPSLPEKNPTPCPQFELIDRRGKHIGPQGRPVLSDESGRTSRLRHFRSRRRRTDHLGQLFGHFGAD